MYGLPNYSEIDPTAFVAITAFLLFGFMFGDVGQGLVIFLIGVIMSKKKISFGAVFQAGGIASIIFGVFSPCLESLPKLISLHQNAF